MMKAMKSAFEAINWKAAHASVVGSKHLKAGFRCQDASAIKVNQAKDALAACVCDGAGSARYSDLGAEAVANAVTKLLCEKANKFISNTLAEADILKTARAAIDEQVKIHGGEVKDYACTIVALLVTNEKAVTAHLGDGVIAMVEDSSPRVLSSPDNGEFANQTFFVTSSSAPHRMRVNVIPISPLVKSFALMSDGAQASLYDKKNNIVSSVVEQMASWLDDAPAEEVNLGMQSAIQDSLIPKTDDDCTVAVIRRGIFLQPYSCPVCRASESLRGFGGKTKFKIRCESCEHIQLFEAETRRGYPEYIRNWVRYLACNKNKAPKQIHQITRIPVKTVYRWTRRKAPKGQCY
jgi:transposase-like protein